MGINTNIFSEYTGKIKILSIIAGAICVGLTVDHYRNVTDEEAFFGSTVACLAISVALALASMVGLLESSNAKQIDKIYHLLAAILLIITASFFIVSLDKQGNCLGTCKNWYAQRAAAGAFGLLQGVVCGYVGFILM